jgi:IS5 family transposase
VSQESGHRHHDPEGRLFRKRLAKAGLVEKLFERFGRHLEAKGYIARGGQMVDATIVPVAKQRNSRDENDEVKAGKTAER